MEETNIPQEPQELSEEQLSENFQTLIEAIVKDDADRIAQEAEANYQARVALATGEAARFNAMYAEYARYPEVTRARMYLEMLELLLPNMKIYINTTDNGATMLIPVEAGAVDEAQAAVAARAAED